MRNTKSTTNLKICIFGITGSIGTQTVEIAKKMGIQIVGCSFHSNFEKAKQIISTNKIKYFYCSDNTVNGNCLSYDDLIKKSQPDLVINAVIGFAGLKATLASLHNKVDIALANKESVVVAGWYIFPYAKKHNLKIIPIDSEHSNLYRQLLCCNDKQVRQLYITCSGGKYFNFTKKQLSKVTFEQATKHNNWSMGQKITVDSNTLMNKCFEVIEAYWYFNTKKINVLLDKTSIIHSGVMLNNGDFFYTNSKPLMTGPIIWALTDFQYDLPDVLKQEPKTTILNNINHVKPIKWAFDIMEDKTNSLAITINAADEVAIKLFQAKMLRFDQITDYVENAIKKVHRKTIKTIDDLYEFDKYVRLASIKYWK